MYTNDIHKSASNKDRTYISVNTMQNVLNKRISLATAWQAVEDNNYSLALRGFRQNIRYQSPRALTHNDHKLVLELNRYRAFMTEVAHLAATGNQDAITLLHFNADALTDVAQTAQRIYSEIIK